jgi:hypothetical protein
MDRVPNGPVIVAIRFECTMEEIPWETLLVTDGSSCVLQWQVHNAYSPDGDVIWHSDRLLWITFPVYSVTQGTTQSSVFEGNSNRAIYYSLYSTKGTKNKYIDFFDIIS